MIYRASKQLLSVTPLFSDTTRIQSVSLTGSPFFTPIVDSLHFGQRVQQERPDLFEDNNPAHAALREFLERKGITGLSSLDSFVRFLDHDPTFEEEIDTWLSLAKVMVANKTAYSTDSINLLLVELELHLVDDVPKLRAELTSSNDVEPAVNFGVIEHLLKRLDESGTLEEQLGVRLKLAIAYGTNGFAEKSLAECRKILETSNNREYPKIRTRALTIMGNENGVLALNATDSTALELNTQALRYREAAIAIVAEHPGLLLLQNTIKLYKTAAISASELARLTCKPSEKKNFDLKALEYIESAIKIIQENPYIIPPDAQFDLYRRAAIPAGLLARKALSGDERKRFDLKALDYREAAIRLFEKNPDLIPVDTQCGFYHTAAISAGELSRLAINPSEKKKFALKALEYIEYAVNIIKENPDLIPPKQQFEILQRAARSAGLLAKISGSEKNREAQREYNQKALQYCDYAIALVEKHPSLISIPKQIDLRLFAGMVNNFLRKKAEALAHAQWVLDHRDQCKGQQVERAEEIVLVNS